MTLFSAKGEGGLRIDGRWHQTGRRDTFSMRRRKFYGILEPLFIRNCKVAEGRTERLGTEAGVHIP